jgi:RNA polymerase sigma-70 factor (ECF subfamily)
MATVELTDEALLSRIARGDAEALGMLYDRYNRLAIGVAYRVLGEHGASEDTVQEAFLSVWRRVDSFDPARGTVRSWLLTIVRNGAVDRRRGRHGRALQDTTLEDVAFKLATDGEQTFDIVAASVEAEHVREALNMLPPEQREAIELAYFGGLTHQEIAARTGAPLGTIKGRMRLGLHKMRQLIGDAPPPTDGATEVEARESGGPVMRETHKPKPFARWRRGRPRLRLAPVAG